MFILSAFLILREEIFLFPFMKFLMLVTSEYKYLKLEESICFDLQEFDDYRDADDAVYELNHKEMLNTKISLEHARPSRERNAGGDRRGGRDDNDRYSGGRGGGSFRFRDKYVYFMLNCLVKSSCTKLKCSITIMPYAEQSILHMSQCSIMFHLYI